MDNEIMKGNIKLSVFDSFPYEELKKVCDSIVKLGYDCEFIENGNIVFQNKTKSEEFKPLENLPDESIEGIMKEGQKPNYEKHKKGKEKFKPSEQQLIQWVDEDVTEGQEIRLVNMGYSKEDIKLMSKLDAWQIINNCQKENI